MKRTYMRLSILVGILLLTNLLVVAQESTEPITVFVGPVMVDCEGVAPQKCMLIRESPDEPYGLFYDQIEGFDYKEGQEYELRVMVEEVENPPADASSLRYRLVEVLTSRLSLEGNHWKADSYRNRAGETVNVLPNTRATAQFRDGEVNGNASCNNYFGSYTMDGQNIQISEQLGMTQQLCNPPEVAQQESEYLSALISSRTFKIENEQAIMTDANGNVVLTFSLLKPAPLTSTNWTVLRYNNGRGGVTSVIRDTEITALFATDGQLTGSGGCNNYSATYEVNGNDITIQPEMAMTMMACPEPQGVEQQEREYLGAIAQAASFSIVDNELELRNSEGQRLVTYRVKPDITGIEWQWQYAHELNGEGVAVPNPAQYKLTLNPDGTVNILADCNSASGFYQVSGNRIRIEVETMTQALCAPESLSDQFIQGLSQASFYEVSDANLFLSPGAEGSIMIFGKS